MLHPPALESRAIARRCVNLTLLDQRSASQGDRAQRDQVTVDLPRLPDSLILEMAIRFAISQTASKQCR
jgi:hypothetical protein